MEGIVLIDKDKGMTSYDVIRVMKRKIRESGVEGKFKIGHSGTLDPIATGLLVVAVGKNFTKKLTEMIGLPKTYRVELEFGKESTTYDAEGELSDVAGGGAGGDGLTDVAITKVVQEKLTGKLSQMPPKFSAKKVGGRRAYDLAREGKEFKLQPKEIEVFEWRDVEVQWPKMTATIDCSSGTYIRSLVHDLGQELKVGAYMTELARLTVGDMSIDDAVKVDDWDPSSIESSHV
jgi:tRNA pseudouridine55 synthase